MNDEIVNNKIESASSNKEKKVIPVFDDESSIGAESALSSPVDGSAEIMLGGIGGDSLGQRLRAARESRAWNTEEVARRLHLPVGIINNLESDNYERIGHSVYLRGYLRSYLRLVDLPVMFAERITKGVDEIPRLITTGQISHSRYLFERYSVPVVYLILTGLIVMPAVWMATHGGLEQNLARIAPLDVPVPVEGSLLPDQVSSLTNSAKSTHPNSVTEASAENNATTEIVHRSSIPESPMPLVASMASFYSHPTNQTDNNLTDQSSISLMTANTAKTLRLKLHEASWVEIWDKNGQRIEYGLLAAGTEREYPSVTPLNVRIGNANGATLEVDGKAIDLAPYRYGNVARFKLFEKPEGTVPSEF